MKIGIDWGGTKIEAAAFDSLNNKEITRKQD
jgi:predicted NBD/HSP70 family sugar kinase